MTAIHLEPCHRPTAGQRRHEALDALSDAAHWVRATLREWRRRLSDRELLMRMDDRMLQDIGMTHAERVALVNKPFWRE